VSDLLSKSITIKIVSLLFAIVLWFVVNPVKTVHLSIPLNIINESELKDKNISIKNNDFPHSIDVEIIGRKEILNDITSESFEAFLDFSKIKSAEDNSISIDGPNYIGKESGIFISSINSKAVNVQLERIVQKTLKVDLVTTGNLQKGFKVLSMASSPNSVSLEGTESMMNSIGSVKAILNLNTINKDSLVKISCRVYDINGKEISELNKNLSVDVTIKVAKEVQLNLILIGKSAPGYVFVSGIISPNKVLITGPRNTLKGITELNTLPFNISNIKRNMVETTKIQIPEGVSLVNQTSDVTISVTVEQLINKEFDISSNSISLINTNINNDLSYIVPPASLKIKIRGTHNQLQNLNLSSFKPNINVTGLLEGIHKVPLQLTLPSTVRLAQNYTVDLIIQKK